MTRYFATIEKEQKKWSIAPIYHSFTEGLWLAVPSRFYAVT